MTAERVSPEFGGRGTRPRNRRTLIIAAATDLFYRQGYAHVSMSEIARAVGIGPSALYRHFNGKQQLLREVIREGLAELRQPLAEYDLSGLTGDPSPISALALDHRELGVFWQREVRHLPQADRAVIRQELRDIGQAFTTRLRQWRPELNPAAADLLTWTVLSVLASSSFHRLSLPRQENEALLGQLVRAVLDFEPPTDFADPPTPTRRTTLSPHSRREALLVEAIRMFSEDGYASVGIEDIGASLGISGTGIYRHFPNKLDMLVTASNRGITWLRMNLSHVLDSHTSAADALGELIASYLYFARAHWDLIGLLVTEQQHLPDNERQQCRLAQREYIDEWVHLLRTIHPHLNPTSARIRVHAVLTAANDVARTPHLRDNPAAPAALAGIFGHMLDLPGARTGSRYVAGETSTATTSPVSDPGSVAADVR